MDEVGVVFVFGVVFKGVWQVGRFEAITFFFWNYSINSSHNLHPASLELARSVQTDSRHCCSILQGSFSVKHSQSRL